ncbi:hypothetical protein K0M31_004239 [Melipona bicolor]|uniref:Uncharacterized protein n=1 Tax=Melipona bicolor TaxID=60889 RepID=A0AA40FX05_9HYME|nr:hypothetical protein K0M31_004239 [Melipona bicolor]
MVVQKFLVEELHNITSTPFQSIVHLSENLFVLIFLASKKGLVTLESKELVLSIFTDNANFVIALVFKLEAYRKWVCSSLVPYFAHGEPQDLNSSSSWAGSRLRPCRSYCQSVEQRCPYLLPGDRAPAYPTQYAGEPTFLCRGKVTP